MAPGRAVRRRTIAAADEVSRTTLTLSAAATESTERQLEPLRSSTAQVLHERPGHNRCVSAPPVVNSDWTESERRFAWGDR
jgi:hypothetical protein